jgi:predicted phage terminase large subunit-like protein
VANVLATPPGFPVERYLAKLKHSGMAHSAYRREVCRTSPILFALVYMQRHITLRDTLISLSQFHVDIAMAAKEWMRTVLAPKECRHVWVAPRKGAKSTWLFLILALWAMAYGHRRYIVVYADTEDMGKGHLARLKHEFRDNARLKKDFPDLCRPMRDGRKDNSTAYLSASDCLIEIKGMNSATLGSIHRERRPDALFFDDIEPKEGDYSAARKEKRLIDLIDAIFPCNDEAVVQIVGTTVMHGSIIHDVIEGKPWVAAQNIQTHYYPAIVEHPVTGEETSCWPQRWALEYLRKERAENVRSYAKNFDNQPVGMDGSYWDAEDITYRDLSLQLTDRVLVLDPAAKSKKKNDETGIAMLGYVASRRTVLVERVIGVRLKPEQLKARVHSIVTHNNIKLILVDTTNGGDHVLNTLAPLPVGVKIADVSISRGKADRFATLHSLYQQGRVVHARPLGSLEAQMKAYPRVLHDDQIDAVCLGVEHFLADLLHA